MQRSSLILTLQLKHKLFQCQAEHRRISASLAESLPLICFRFNQSLLLPVSYLLAT